MYVLYLILVILQEYDLAAVKILLSYIIEENISCFSDITVPYKELKVFIFHTFHSYFFYGYAFCIIMIPTLFLCF